MYRSVGLYIGAVIACTSVAAPIDYAREERWAQEVVPSIVVGDAVYLSTTQRSRVLAILATPSGASKGAIVLVHGLGVHPDFGITGAVRTRLIEAGYTTLSVQMPVLAAGASREDYRDAMPQAVARIAAAIAYVRSKGADKVAIVSHSLGASMVNAYLARADAAPVEAWIPVGMFGAFAVTPKQPVLDVIAQNEIEPVQETAPARLGTLPKDPCSKQITIARADHYFEREQGELVARITEFLARAFANKCK